MWQRYTLDEPVTIQVGDGRWRFRRDGGDLLWLADRLASGELPAAEPEAATWQRWCDTQPVTAVWLRPALPDKPVVVRPSQVLSLGPQSKVVVFMALPLWLQVLTNDRPDAVPVLDHPIQTLSKTWFGPSPSQGQICYQVRGEAQRLVPEASQHDAIHAWCALQIINESRHMVPLERLFLRCSLLACWQGENGIWTNDLTVLIREEGNVPELKVGSGPSTRCAKPVSLAKPREPAHGLLSIPLFLSGRRR